MFLSECISGQLAAHWAFCARRPVCSLLTDLGAIGDVQDRLFYDWVVEKQPIRACMAGCAADGCRRDFASESESISRNNAPPTATNYHYDPLAPRNPPRFLEVQMLRRACDQKGQTSKQTTT